MSGINGDKSRFHRIRKHKSHLRERNQKMFKALAQLTPPASSRVDAKPKEKLS